VGDTLKIFVDIDGTICRTKDANYSEAVPIHASIQKINKLYDLGHEIIFWTARGSANKEESTEILNITNKQLQEWGCRYTQLSVGEKPVYDLLICDKSVRIDEL